MHLYQKNNKKAIEAIKVGKPPGPDRFTTKYYRI